MKTPLEKAIYREISLRNDESLAKDKVNDETITWFVNTWSSIITRAANKFVVGQREHGGDFFTDCNHIAEADNELVDLIHYSYAAKHKHIKSRS